MVDAVKLEKGQEVALTREEHVWLKAWSNAIKANNSYMDSRLATNWADACLVDFKSRFGSSKM